MKNDFLTVEFIDGHPVVVTPKGEQIKGIFKIDTHYHVDDVPTATIQLVINLGFKA